MSGLYVCFVVILAGIEFAADVFSSVDKDPATNISYLIRPVERRRSFHVDNLSVDNVKSSLQTHRNPSSSFEFVLQLVLLV